MYIYANMANLQKCSRCKSTIDISFFGLNRKNEPNKTCVNCRSTANMKSITCINTDAIPLKRSDVDFVDGSFSDSTNPTSTTNNDDCDTHPLAEFARKVNLPHIALANEFLRL